MQEIRKSSKWKSDKVGKVRKKLEIRQRRKSEKVKNLKMQEIGKSIK